MPHKELSMISNFHNWYISISILSYGLQSQGYFLTHWVIQGLNHHPFGMKLISLFEKWYELIMLIYCKAFLHLDPYHSCASVCLHLSSGLAFIPKEEPDPLGSMHIYINTAYIGSLWRPKKENHLQIVNVSSEDGTRWVFLRTVLNIVVCVSWSIILLKSVSSSIRAIIPSSSQILPPVTFLFRDTRLLSGGHF